MRGTTKATRNTARFWETKIYKACWRSTGMIARRTSGFLCEWSRFRRGRLRQSDKGDMWIVIRGSRPAAGCWMWISGEVPRGIAGPSGASGAYRGPIAADHAIGGMASTPLKKLRFHHFSVSREPASLTGQFGSDKGWATLAEMFLSSVPCPMPTVAASPTPTCRLASFRRPA